MHCMNKNNQRNENAYKKLLNKHTTVSVLKRTYHLIRHESLIMTIPFKDLNSCIQHLQKPFNLICAFKPHWLFYSYNQRIGIFVHFVIFIELIKKGSNSSTFYDIHIFKQICISK